MGSTATCCRKALETLRVFWLAAELNLNPWIREEHARDWPRFPTAAIDVNPSAGDGTPVRAGELAFDSRLMTHANLGRINEMGIDFLTLRRRSASLLKAIAHAPEDDWKQVRLNNVGRICRTLKVLYRHIRISGYPDDIRQLAVRDLGHDRATLLLTNQTGTSAGQLVDRHIRRMVIENDIAGAIDFFHRDALSALLAMRIGNGKQTAKSRTLFRNFIKAPADITIENDSIDVRIGRRANNPFLLNARYDETDIAVPWLKDRRLRISFRSLWPVQATGFRR